MRPPEVPGLAVDEHPLLHARALLARFPAPLGELESPAEVRALLGPGAGAPLADEELRQAVRALLRHGGWRPAGRGKPSSEYLARAAAEGALGAINLAVDAGNGVSLASGIPISVVDLGRLAMPLRIGIAPPGAAFVFNASGQEIALEGLLCLFDAEGPCANAVKDAQRTKTSAETRATLSILWAPRAWAEHGDRTRSWYRELLERAGAGVETVL